MKCECGLIHTDKPTIEEWEQHLLYVIAHGGFFGDKNNFNTI